MQGAGHAELHLRDRLVEQERGGDEPLPAGRLQPRQLAVELLRVALEAGQVRLGIRRGPHRVLGIEEPRDVEEGAHVLDHHVGRVAPPADGDVAIREREAVERDAVRRLHDLDGGPGRVRLEGARVDRLGLGQVGTEQRRQGVLTGPAAIGELRPQRRARVGVEAQRGGGFRRPRQQALANRVEDGLGGVLAGGNGRFLGRRHGAPR